MKIMGTKCPYCNSKNTKSLGKINVNSKYTTHQCNSCHGVFSPGRFGTSGGFSGYEGFAGYSS